MDGETAPLGTIPVYRNHFEGYVSGDSGASSLRDYLENHQEMGRTDGAKRLYAGFRTPTPNTGAVGWVNQFEGSVERGTFSLIEVAVSCRGPNYPHTLQQIGIVLSRDSANFGDSILSLHVEFFTEGPKNFAINNRGGWDHRQDGLTPVQGWSRASPSSGFGAAGQGSKGGFIQEERQARPPPSSLPRLHAKLEEPYCAAHSASDVQERQRPSRHSPMHPMLRRPRLGAVRPSTQC
jgi:hypothetical protein